MTADPTLFILAAAFLAALVLLVSGRRPASVQAGHLALERIEDGVMTFADGRHRAVLEVGSVNFALLGEGQQRELVAGYAAVLNSLTFPVQILVRATPLDLTPYLAAMEARARREPRERLRRLAYDRMAFLRRLAAERTLLERRFYVVVPADDPGPGAGWRPGHPTGAGRRGEAAALRAATARAAAIRQLAFRCDDLAAQLGRCGLAARRLADGELAQLLYDCWCPELARSQRLRDELTGYAGLTVGSRAGATPGNGRRAGAGERSAP